MLRAVSSDEAPPPPALPELGRLLTLAVEAEADGEALTDVADKERKAKEHVLFMPNGFREFGAAAQVPKRAYSSEELKAEGVNPTNLLEVDDATEGVRKAIIATILFGGLGLAVALKLSAGVVNTVAFSIILFAVVDQLVNQGLFQFLILDSIAGVVNSEYRKRVLEHEAARFLVGYLIGVLPKAYALSSTDALGRYGSPRIRTGSTFCTATFQTELESGKLSSKTVDRFVCVRLAGVAQEYIAYTKAKTGIDYVSQINSVFDALEWEQRRRNDEIRWALLNVVTILRRHQAVHGELVRAMERGARIQDCIGIIEVGVAAARLAEAQEAQAAAAA